MDLWGKLWDDPQREFDGRYHCAKFGCNRISHFDNTKFEYVISHIRHVPNGAFVMNFGMRGVIADVISHDKFFCQSVLGFWGSDPQNFAISVGLAGRLAVLNCDHI